MDNKDEPNRLTLKNTPTITGINIHDRKIQNHDKFIDHSMERIISSMV